MEFLKPIFSQNYYGKFCFSFEIWWGAHWKIFIWCLYVSFTYIYQNQAPICLAHIFSGKTSSQVQCSRNPCFNRGFLWFSQLVKNFYWALSNWIISSSTNKISISSTMFPEKNHFRLKLLPYVCCLPLRHSM